MAIKHEKADRRSKMRWGAPKSRRAIKKCGLKIVVNANQVIRYGEKTRKRQLKVRGQTHFRIKQRDTRRYREFCYETLTSPSLHDSPYTHNYAHQLCNRASSPENDKLPHPPVFRRPLPAFSATLYYFYWVWL